MWGITCIFHRQGFTLYRALATITLKHIQAHACPPPPPPITVNPWWHTKRSWQVNTGKRWWPALWHVERQVMFGSAQVTLTSQTYIWHQRVANNVSYSLMTLQCSSCLATLTLTHLPRTKLHDGWGNIPIFIHIDPSIHWSIDSSIDPSIHPSIRFSVAGNLCTCLSARLLIHLSTYSSVHLFIFLFIISVTYSFSYPNHPLIYVVHWPCVGDEGEEEEDSSQHIRSAHNTRHLQPKAKHNHSYFHIIWYAELLTSWQSQLITTSLYSACNSYSYWP